MNNIIFTNAVRFIFLVLLQALVLQRIQISWAYNQYFHAIVFPLFIILLPHRTPHFILVLLGFLIGITVDLFYDSLGIHASASVFLAFVRPWVLKMVAPQGGYNTNFSPTKARYGVRWFFLYVSIMMMTYLFFYFSVEVFTFYYLGEIVLRTICSFFLSMGFIIILQTVFNPIE